jgi:pantetheine-phosphate adenylyltransferase
VGKRAVYPGMFDPMHNGHLDLIERSLRIFDELIVAVVANPSKEPLFSVKERLELIDEATHGLTHMRITSFDGLLIDLVDREARTASCAAFARCRTSSTSSRWRS